MFTPYPRDQRFRYQYTQNLNSYPWYYDNVGANRYTNPYRATAAQQRNTIQFPRADADSRRDAYRGSAIIPLNQSSKQPDHTSLVMLRPRSDQFGQSWDQPQTSQARRRSIAAYPIAYGADGFRCDESSSAGNDRFRDHSNSMSQYRMLDGAGGQSSSHYSDSPTGDRCRDRPQSMLQYHIPSDTDEYRYDAYASGQSHARPQSVSQYRISNGTGESHYDDTAASQRGRSRSRHYPIMADTALGVRHKRDCSLERWQKYVKHNRKRSSSFTDSTLAALGDLKDHANVASLSRSLLRSLGHSVSSCKTQLLDSWLQDTPPPSRQESASDSRAIVKAGPRQVGWANPLIEPSQEKAIIPQRFRCAPRKGILKNMEITLLRNQISPRALPHGEKYRLTEDGDIVLYRCCEWDELDRLTQKTALLRNGYAPVNHGFL